MLSTRRFAVIGDAVRYQFSDGSPVAIHDAWEFPLVAENLGQSEGIRARRDAVERVEGAHDGGAAFVKGCIERRQIHFAQVML